MHTIVFRTTNECNLRCTYCYDGGNHDNTTSCKIATDNFAKNEKYIIDDTLKIFANTKRPTFIFHGGEPLLVDPELLEHFCQSLQKQKSIKFNIQTNGTLINDRVIKLFRNNNFHVGISLDGATEYQNSARQYPSGANSFHTVIEKIKLLQSEKIKFGIVISINKLHLGQEQVLYDFLAKYGINCNIRPVFETMTGNNSLVMSEEEFITFFNNLFDIWYNDQLKKVSTRQITEFFRELQNVILGKSDSRSCECSPNCFLNFISLDTDGELYACNRLYHVPQFYYGNIRKMTMEEVQKKAIAWIEERRIAIEKQCGNCSLLKNCYGGCPAEAYSSYGTINTPSKACHIKQAIKQHIKRRYYNDN